MSTALQVALFAASVAVVLLVVCAIPLAVLVLRRVDRLIHIVEELRTNAEVTMHDGRELMWQVNELSKRVTRQMDEVDQIVCIARQWTERADRLVDGVGSIVEPPVMALAQGSRLARVGLTAFLKALFLGRRPAEKEEKQD